MKKGLIALSTLVLLAASGCSSTDNSELTKKISTLEAEINTLKSENKKLKEASSSNSAKTETQVKSETVMETAAEEKSPSLTKGKALTIDGIAEFTVLKSRFSKKVEPSSPTSVYTYYEAKGSDTTYLVLVTKIKNLADSGKTADEIVNAKIKYDDKYEYTSFTVIEEDNGANFDYTTISPISPLSSSKVLFLAEVPKEVESSNKQLTAEVSVNGVTYQYKIR
ncbi:bZIP transcription factor [Paenibacillus sp. SN-8-1]|uniref:bZIP transcription factor n=1 Tax=Paenibacillus sp. SN-8-1 TaxID=3435409 RepID=UPI003D9A4F73